MIAQRISVRTGQWASFGGTSVKVSVFLYGLSLVGLYSYTLESQLSRPHPPPYVCIISAFLLSELVYYIIIVETVVFTLKLITNRDPTSSCL